MKTKDIKELIEFITDLGLAEVNLETAELKLHVKKQAGEVVATTPIQVAQPQVTTPIVTTPTVQEASPTTTSAPAQEESSSNYVEVKSPMIGTFYGSPNPDSPSFVNVGDTIKSGDVVCIIEAMKLFNEVESEVSGKIVKVLVENASPVEYDQPLFLVDPS